MLYETVDRYFASCENEWPRPAPTLLLQPEKNLVSQYISSRSKELLNSSETEYFKSCSRKKRKHQDEAVHLMASGPEKIELPKREFISFDSNPKKNPRFIKSFDINTERRENEDDEKLSYLLQYCKGAAKDV